MAVVLRALGPIDVKSIWRDPLLRWFILVPLLMGAGVRFLLPLLVQPARQLFDFDLAAYYPLWMSMIALVAPMLVGAVIGFLLLDSRDDGTLEALRVTPLSLGGYLLYRCAVPVGLGVLATLVVIPLSGLAPLPFGGLVLVALAAAPFGPLTALYLAAFAENKVQGLALLKVFGVILLPPLAAYFVPPGWQVLFGLAPTFWPMKVYWLLSAGAGGAIWPALAGIVYQGLLIAWLLRRFRWVLSR